MDVGEADKLTKEDLKDYNNEWELIISLAKIYGEKCKNFFDDDFTKILKPTTSLNFKLN